MPAYIPNKNDVSDRTNANVFKKHARNLNLIITNYEYLKDYMYENDMAIMTFWLFQTVLRYVNQMSDAREKGLESGYYVSQFLRKSANKPDFIQVIDDIN